jgi:hypothetical protein
MTMPATVDGLRALQLERSQGKARRIDDRR